MKVTGAVVDDDEVVPGPVSMAVCVLRAYDLLQKSARSPTTNKEVK